MANSELFCWDRVGVRGDRSCDKLDDVIHCRFCETFRRNSTAQLSSESTEDYLISLFERMNAESEGPTHGVALVVFRLHETIFGLPVDLTAGITRNRAITPIPRRSNEIFLGLVNIDGTLELCFSLHVILDISHVSRNPYLLRMMHNDQSWVFPVDEVVGVYRFDENMLECSNTNQYARGTVQHNRASVHWLEPDLIVQAMKESLA